MDTQTIKRLILLNNDFYRIHGASFSSTRQSFWPGWRNCLDVLRNDSTFDLTRFSVFDLACGNLRFAVFLESELPDSDISFFAVDNNTDVLPQLPKVSFQKLDLLGLLYNRQDLAEHISAPVCDLTVSFGFMHHVPTFAYRQAILQAIVDTTSANGYIILSFWNFLNSDVLAERAHSYSRKALNELAVDGLEQGDFILGWNNLTGAYRYCHSFDDAEIDCLLDSLPNRIRLIDRFVSDGRTKNLNTYVVLKR